MGVVYLASDPADRPVAVKVLRQGVPAEATARRRLAREVDTMRRVHSPFVAEVLDADVEGSPPYIVTQYAPGRSLEDVVTSDGPLTGAALASLARGLASALVAIHAAGIVHRDLKPGNVMLVNGDPVVIDFGIAQAPDSTRLTMTGMFMGTPGYLAPEVIEGKPSGPAADVHSCAATLAYAATGHPPFGTGQFEAIFYRIVHGQPELDRMPAQLLPIVLAALARDPSRRPTAADLSGLVAELSPAGLVPSPAGAVMTGIPAAAALAGQSGLATRTAMDLPAPGARRPAAWRPRRLPRQPGRAPGRLRPARAMISPICSPRSGTSLLTGAGSLARPRRGTSRQAALAAGIGALGASARSAGGAAACRAGRGHRRLAAGPASSSAASPARTPLVLATLAVLIAVSVLLPVAGAAAALAVLILLRAADLTTNWLSRRRSRQGARPRRCDIGSGLLPMGRVPVGAELHPAGAAGRPVRGRRRAAGHAGGRLSRSCPAPLPMRPERWWPATASGPARDPAVVRLAGSTAASRGRPRRPYSAHSAWRHWPSAWSRPRRPWRPATGRPSTWATSCRPVRSRIRPSAICPAAPAASAAQSAALAQTAVSRC